MKEQIKLHLSCFVNIVKSNRNEMKTEEKKKRSEIRTICLFYLFRDLKEQKKKTESKSYNVSLGCVIDKHIISACGKYISVSFSFD